MATFFTNVVLHFWIVWYFSAIQVFKSGHYFSYDVLVGITKAKSQIFSRALHGMVHTVGFTKKETEMGYFSPLNFLQSLEKKLSSFSVEGDKKVTHK